MSDRDDRQDKPPGVPATERMSGAPEPSTDRSPADRPPIPARPSGAFLRTADDGPPLAYEAYPRTPPIEDDDPLDFSPADEHSGAWDDPPRAVRPLGQLGGIETVGFALSRPASAQPRITQRPSGGPAAVPPGRIANDDETPEDELPPTLPPRSRENRAEAPTRTIANEQEKLELWLLQLLRRGVPEPTEAERLERWLESLDMAATFEQERRRP